MKIALFISSLGTGGAERALSELANYWSRQGHDVSLYTLSSPDSVPFYPLEKSIILHQLDLMAPDKSGPWKKYSAIFQRVWTIRKELKKQNPDFILSFMDVMNVQVILASLGLSKKVVVCERTNPFLRPLPALYKKLRRLTYPLAEVVVQTESVKRYFNFLKQGKLHVINNVLRPLPSFEKKTQRHKIVSVGRLCFYKGFDLLIQAFASLEKGFPQYTIEIYGEGSERGHLEVLIEKHRLEKKVFLRGISNHIEDALQNASVFVFPSRFEGFPNALTEAMAMGLPCLASDTPGCDELIQHDNNGLLFRSEDVGSLETQLRKLLPDQSLQERLAQQALHVRERLSPDTIYPLWDALLPTDRQNP